MSATAFQLRRRQEAAERIVARLDTAARRKRFIKAAPLLACAEADAAALYDAIASYTDPGKLLALADDIDSAKRRHSRRRKTETQK